MPLEVCKLSRSSRSRICKEDTYAFPDKGYCASQSTNYYGYKLHAVCSVSGVFQSIDLSLASLHGVNYLKDIKVQISDCTLIGDRGYLFKNCNIKLNTPMRNNQKDSKYMTKNMKEI